MKKRSFELNIPRVGEETKNKLVDLVQRIKQYNQKSAQDVFGVEQRDSEEIIVGAVVRKGLKSAEDAGIFKESHVSSVGSNTVDPSTIQQIVERAVREALSKTNKVKTTRTYKARNNIDDKTLVSRFREAYQVNPALNKAEFARLNNVGDSKLFRALRPYKQEFNMSDNPCQKK